MEEVNGLFKFSLFYDTTIAAMKERFNLTQALVDNLYDESSQLYYVNASYMADYFISLTSLDPKATLDLKNDADYILYTKMKIMYYATMNDYTSVKKLAHVGADPMWKYINANIINKLDQLLPTVTPPPPMFPNYV